LQTLQLLSLVTCGNDEVVLMAPRIGRSTTLALKHPWLVAVGSGVLMGCWVAGMLHMTLLQAVVAGCVVALIQVVLWFPRVGPARRHANRIQREEQNSPGA
jgi:hypothetical protein